MKNSLPKCDTQNPQIIALPVYLNLLSFPATLSGFIKFLSNKVTVAVCL